MSFVSSLPLSRCTSCGNEGAPPLPQHIWCWVAEFNDISEVGALMACRPRFLGAFEEEALWRYHAFATGAARTLQDSNACWIDPFISRIRVERCVDWRRLLHANYSHGKNQAASFIWIRFTSIDLRIPVPGGMRCTMDVLADVGLVLRPDVDLRSHRPLRLRATQWSGQPGIAFEDDSLVNACGQTLLLELSGPTSRQWPLPPNDSTTQRGHRMRLLSSEVTGAPFHESWLQLHGGADFSVSPSSSSSGPTRGGPGSGSLLVRVVSLLLRHELWVQVSAHANLATLYGVVLAALQREGVMLRHSHGRPRLRLAEGAYSKVLSDALDSKPLRELFWAQCETVRIELDAPRRVATPGSRCPSGEPDDEPILLVMWREQRLVHASTLGAEGDDQEPLKAMGRFGLARQQSEPALWQPAPTRQVSEPARHAQASRNLGQSLQDSARRGSQSMCVQEHCASELEISSLNVVPEFVDLDFIFDEMGGASEGRGDMISNNWESLVPHHPPRVLKQTHRVRQFEFHPTLPHVLLLGDKRGAASVVDTLADEVHAPLNLGSCPLLGLVWFHHTPQYAVCGASHSGKICLLRYNPLAPVSEPALERVSSPEPFPKLSSLSVNCSDDFLLASGISPNLAVYDVHTGQQLVRAPGVHDNFVNISRFSHTSPHIFATASFDHTCRIWDLRLPVTQNTAVKTLHTGGFNVMCVFSQDDKYLLCSGVDTRIKQFEVQTWRSSPTSFPLREPVHEERYRRSTYLASSKYFVTGATEESHVHVMSVEGANMGVVDFRGLVCGDSAGIEHFSGERLVGEGRRRLRVQRAQPCGAAKRDLNRANLVRGVVKIQNSGPDATAPSSNHEFVQSIRAHPTQKNRVGVLLSLTQGEHSYVAMVDLDPYRYGR